MSQNEAGAVNGRPRVVRSHRDFRLILAVDPRHGEVSRAMRNRGVELCLLPEQPDKLLMPEKTRSQVAASTEMVQFCTCFQRSSRTETHSASAFGL